VNLVACESGIQGLTQRRKARKGGAGADLCASAPLREALRFVRLEVGLADEYRSGCFWGCHASTLSTVTQKDRVSRKGAKLAKEGLVQFFAPLCEALRFVRLEIGLADEYRSGCLWGCHASTLPTETQEDRVSRKGAKLAKENLVQLFAPLRLCVRSCDLFERELLDHGLASMAVTWHAFGIQKRNFTKRQRGTRLAV